jgi:hypothetical protein
LGAILREEKTALRSRATTGKNRVQTPTWNCTVSLGIFGCVVQRALSLLMNTYQVQFRGHHGYLVQWIHGL